ncbi:MAG: LamG-like jellyroll fold domain-containing protein [Verrucomicrobiales bacterium]
MKTPILYCALLLLLIGVAAGQSPTVHTNRKAEQVLPLPKGDDVFHFVVFGDRTGGPPEGVKLLAQAVKDTNLLDPDLVMTVGDLIQGYNDLPKWEPQMKEYKATMSGLKMPWFPVAGNHDIFWRGDGRPPNEHDGNYEKHFGPLWYWFEHKKCGYLVVFSDEGDPQKPDEVRDFNDVAQQKFSDAQLAWVREALAQMKGLKHIFVFMHHPRWALELYPGSNWDQVHKLFAESGNVRACFAGHTHRVRTHPTRDRIEYYTLGATGASIPGIYPQAGYLHHFNVVAVRAEGIKVSTVTVGSVLDPKIFTPERQVDMDKARESNPEHLSPRLSLNADGLGAGFYEMRFKNPSQRPLEITLSQDPARDWIFTPGHQHGVIEPGQDKKFFFTWARVKPGLEGAVLPPVLTLDLDYIEEAMRTPLPARKVSLPLSLKGLPTTVFDPAAPEVALRVTREKTGVRVESTTFDLPDGPFTIECWVRPEIEQPTAGLVAKTQSSDYGLLVEKNIVSFLVYLNDRYSAATAKDPIALNKWTHVAGVCDGQSVALYLNGKKSDSTPAKGFRQRNDLPLYLGADPDHKSEPSRSFFGAVDEVRLSKVPRYTAEFTPERRHKPDENTILLFHLDRLMGGFFPDHSASQAHSRATGQVDLVPAP